MIKNLRWKYMLIFIVIAGSIWLSYPLREKIHLGLDLQGGDAPCAGGSGGKSGRGCPEQNCQ